MNTKNWAIIAIINILCFSCLRPKPQLPSNKVYTADSVLMALENINIRLIEKEDSILTEIVSKQHTEFTKTESGFWIYSDCSKKTDLLKQHDKCSFSVKIFSLQGNLLMAENQTIHIGRKETLQGIEETLKMISKGCSARVFLPWYLAYGSKGKEPEIPPFTSVYAEIIVSDL